MENLDISDWGTQASNPEPVTVEKLDALVEQYAKEREEYEAAKKISGEKYAIYQETEVRLMNTLKSLGKKSYKVDAIGNISLVTKHVVTTPKTLDTKRALFNWINETYGVDVLDDMTSINHQKLNGFYNEEVEKHANDPLFHIPGLELPTPTESISFRRTK